MTSFVGRRRPPLDYPVYLAPPLDDHMGDGEKILNTTTARPGLFWGGFSFARVPLYPPAAPRRLFAVLRPAGGYFALVFSSAQYPPKSKTSVKAIYKPYTAFYTLVAIPIFPSPKTSHRGRQRPAQGIKQPRLAPSWSKPGCYYLLHSYQTRNTNNIITHAIADKSIIAYITPIIYSGRWIARRSAPLFGHTRRRSP